MRILSRAFLALALPLVAGPALAHDYTTGALRIDHPASRATPPTARVGVGYMVISNDGAEPDRLLGGTSPVAEAVEIHSMTMEGDVMQMRRLEDGLDLPAGEEVALAPGGYHLMLVDLNEPLREGERVPLTLRFEKAGEVTVELAIEAMGMRGGNAADGHQGH
ncbi:copper chaperone PCu(A)C [Aureimonas populi]|uniref:Copper chaperone PCu(A)C n=1 Tax=Aureimonas populi TaxID=1701758 RepID=A0ABW5CM91_9HYPH|nr:copper chaperone PCu(A)C [Aureimonas populi]